jgi:hypothetical protein
MQECSRFWPLQPSKATTVKVQRSLSIDIAVNIAHLLLLYVNFQIFNKTTQEDQHQHQHLQHQYQTRYSILQYTLLIPVHTVFCVYNPIIIINSASFAASFGKNILQRPLDRISCSVLWKEYALCAAIGILCEMCSFCY